MKIEIREATIEDLDTLKSFEQDVISYERQFASNLKNDPIEYYNLKDLMERDDTDLLVATSNGEIVGSGYSQIRISEHYRKPEQFAYLGFMYVMPQYRGKGINRKIIEQLLNKAKERKITEIQLDVYAENESALRICSEIK